MEKTVIIIGAGASAIAAASRLVKLGIDPNFLTILEAQDRIGGRICTISVDGSALELGANWVHGEEDNVVYDMGLAVNELNTDIHTLQSSGIGDGVDFSFEDVQIATEQHQEIVAMLNEIEEEAAIELPTGRWKSYGEYVTSKFHERINSKKSTVDEETAFAILDWFHRLQNVIDGSDDWADTCGPGHVFYRQCPGDPLVTWKRGYSVIFDILLKDMPKAANGFKIPLAERIFLKKVVNQIDWDGNKRSDSVRVSCEDGSIYHADAVLVTCSLGFLKDNADNLFKPVLPLQKRRAIKNLGFGTVDKIFLRFAEPWWPLEWEGVNFLTRQHERSTGDWSTKIQGFFTVRNHPNLLIGWITGAEARLFESLPSDEVLRVCSARLKKHIGAKYAYTEPIELIRSTWYENRFTRGSYSFRAVKSKEQNVWAADLAEPVRDSQGHPRLYFAGEATHDCFYSTVHGAVESGWREADRIARDLFGGNTKSKL